LLKGKAILFVVVVASVMLHELGHALSALAFGDDTAKREGHLTLNPWKVSPFGAVILPAMTVLAGGYPLAFAATPVQPRRMRNPRLGRLVTSLAGPAVNIALIALSVAALRSGLGHQIDRSLALGAGLVTDIYSRAPTRASVAFAVGWVNVILSVFNLLPIPPLDGSALVERVLPRTWWPGWMRFRQYGFLVLFLLVLAEPGLLGSVLRPVLNLWLGSWRTRLRL